MDIFLFVDPFTLPFLLLPIKYVDHVGVANYELQAHIRI